MVLPERLPPVSPVEDKSGGDGAGGQAGMQAASAWAAVGRWDLDGGTS